MMQNQQFRTVSLKNQKSVNPLVKFASQCWLRIKSIFLRRRLLQPYIEKVLGHYIIVLPEVLNPVVFRSGKFFADVLANTLLAKPHPNILHPRALDMGTGCGICAIFTAELGYQVTGVDLNQDAIRCAQTNVLLNNLTTRIEILHGDLFAPVSDKLFDLVLFNPPFYRGSPKNKFDLAWRSNDIFERFANGLNLALTQQGKALILLSTEGDPAGMLDALHENNFKFEIGIQRHFGNEIMTIYEVYPANRRD